MTLFAVGRIAGVVVGITVVVFMTTEAIPRCALVAVARVAGGAVEGCVGAGQRISGRGMIERVVLPTGWIVAERAIARKSCRRMVGFPRSRVIVAVATVTGRIQAVVNAAGMALPATDSLVSARQRITGGGVIEPPVVPRKHVVAGDAIGRKSGGGMVRIR